jgi:uncharacterized protein (TIGR01777 family)
MRIFIAGGTGLVGTPLVRHLRDRGDEVVILTRRPGFAQEHFGHTCTIVEGDPTRSGSWMAAVQDCDAVINLAGENIFHQRWNEDFKTLLRDSRIKSTANVVQALAAQPRSPAGAPKILVNASAIGFYGPHAAEELTEDSPAGDDFLARLCVDWEQAARAAESSGVRVALIRTGLVLDKNGGALPQLLTPFKLFVGGPFGSGHQWVSWIHHADLTGLYLLALDNPLAIGPINGTSPNPVDNREFTHALGQALHRPSFLRTPEFALKLMLGEVAEVICSGQRVLPRKAQTLGYSFQFPHIDGALTDALRPERHVAAA